MVEAMALLEWRHLVKISDTKVLATRKDAK